jgi:hypothetical protein
MAIEANVTSLIQEMMKESPVEFKEHKQEQQQQEPLPGALPFQPEKEKVKEGV